MSKKSGQSFIKGAAILGVAAIIIKVMGAFFRIPLANLIGDEGMSYYQTAYPMYNWLIVISTAGFPAAIAKTIAERTAVGDHYGAHRVFKTILKLMTVIGLIGMLVMMMGAEWVTTYVKNAGGYYSFLALGPAILFVAVMSSFRGYFQGLQDMKPYAYSQIVEQFFRVGLGLGLAFTLFNKGLEFASAGATFGATSGAFFGFLIIFLYYERMKKKGALGNIDTKLPDQPEETEKEIVAKVLKIAVPITIGASVIPIMTMLDLFIVMRRLHDIGIVEQANDLYGQLTGYSQTLVNLPQTVTAAVQISLVPAIAALTAQKAQKELNHTIETGLRLGLIIGLPCALGLVSLAEPIMKLLYPMQIEIASSTGSILAILGWGVLFLSMYQVTTGILQGLGKQNLPARNLFMGAILKGVLSYTLVGIPSLNIRGAAIATVSAFACASILNFASLMKAVDFKPNWSKIFFKPAIDGAVMVVMVKITYYIVNRLALGSFSVLSAGRIATVAAVGIGGITFGLMLFVTNTLTEEDMDMMPGGNKLKKLANKLSLRKAG